MSYYKIKRRGMMPEALRGLLAGVWVISMITAVLTTRPVPAVVVIAVTCAWVATELGFLAYQYIWRLRVVRRARGIKIDTRIEGGRLSAQAEVGNEIACYLDEEYGSQNRPLN